MVYVYNGILLSHNKNEIMLFAATWDCHTKWSKPDRERQISHDIACMWNLKKKIKQNDTKGRIYKIETDPQT